MGVGRVVRGKVGVHLAGSRGSFSSGRDGFFLSMRWTAVGGVKIQTSEEAPAAVQGRSEDSLDLGGSSGGRLQATSSQLWVHSARTPIPTQSPGPRKGADEREGEMGGSVSTISFRLLRERSQGPTVGGALPCFLQPRLQEARAQ
ncbi:hypothetical protein Cadr_000030124 [Camelus dromedarius]|uniref:Uncharacterized protein n=1 Tax=Camelus dromedarius TaxID=9838 RepID=A0A5N4C041_CAMDR|nr:hypothetical protein Cadr_000030124 [Camelus dromedarius]